MNSLRIKYYNQSGAGNIEIYLPEFLGMRKITSVRKMVALIRTSNTPEEIDKLREWIQKRLPAIDEEREKAAEKIHENHEKEKDAKAELDLEALPLCGTVCAVAAVVPQIKAQKSVQTNRQKPDLRDAAKARI